MTSGPSASAGRRGTIPFSSAAAEDCPSDLTTRGGRLVFAYRTDGSEERNVVGPSLREDGRIGITVTRDVPRENVPDRRAKQWLLTLSDRYTVRTIQKGFVLSFVGSAVSPSREWLAFLPASV